MPRIEDGRETGHVESFVESSRARRRRRGKLEVDAGGEAAEVGDGAFRVAEEVDDGVGGVAVAEPEQQGLEMVGG